AQIPRIFLDGYGVYDVRTIIFKCLRLSSRMRYLHGINDVIKVTLFDVINGSGRLGFARVLVEVVAKKGFLDNIKIQYKDTLNNTKRIKYVNVKYSWKPDLCEHCIVFGHGFKNSKARDKTKEEIESERMRKNINANRGNKDGFMEVKE
ncbi:hypothetical protein Tco_1092753, partial [Tanacetum coccineum]